MARDVPIARGFQIRHPSRKGWSDRPQDTIDYVVIRKVPRGHRVDVAYGNLPGNREARGHTDSRRALTSADVEAV